VKGAGIFNIALIHQLAPKFALVETPTPYFIISDVGVSA